MSLSFILILAFLAVLAFSILKILQEYERGVIFRLGRVLKQAKGPGIIFLIPWVDRIVRISVRTITMAIDPQDIISRDNISLKVNAVLYFRVVDPIKCVVNVENYLYATTQLAQTHLRSILGQHTLDELLGERDKINDMLKQILDENTDPWGINVESVEIKDIDLPPDMQRAMARQAEAERERRAKIIGAEGEMQAATKLREAADLLSGNPMTIQLRYMQTMNDIASEKNSTFFFPLPIDIITPFIELAKAKTQELKKNQ